MLILFHSFLNSAKQLNDFKSMRISYQAEMENYEDQEGSFSQNDDSQEDYSADHQGNSNNEISEQHNPRTQEKSDQHTDNVDPEGGLQNHHTQAHASGSQDPENTINIGSGEEAQHQQHSVPQNLSRKSSNTKNTMMNPFAIVQEETLEDSNLSRKGSKVLDEPPGTIHTDDPLLDAVHNAHVAADEKLEGVNFTTYGLFCKNTNRRAKHPLLHLIQSRSSANFLRILRRLATLMRLQVLNLLLKYYPIICLKQLILMLMTQKEPRLIVLLATFK